MGIVTLDIDNHYSTRDNHMGMVVSHTDIAMEWIRFLEGFFSKRWIILATMATPEPAYGVPTVSVVGEGFCVPYPVELIVKRKTKRLSNTCFEVLDVNGNLFLQVDGTSLAFQCKRVMRNPAGFPILTLREKAEEREV
ncbi:hypothetical protein EZV62_022873 [Acer yangbiense]|uniref:Uncharacterized protein n=1 Tax=Acer yangbiense TaxID=1000413 RepID=A0A5C7H0K6_9ROSI|nr:hypothetical protein EZV62_022873 [Acer yangbiense]